MTHRRQHLVLATTCAGALVTGCGAALGAGGFYARYACLDERLVATPPVVEHRADGDYVTWTQGSHPFFFFMEHGIIDGALVFAASVSASSGNLAGQARAQKIEDATALAALRRGDAKWWQCGPEPDGRLVPVEIRDDASAR